MPSRACLLWAALAACCCLLAAQAHAQEALDAPAAAQLQVRGSAARGQAPPAAVPPPLRAPTRLFAHSPAQGHHHHGGHGHHHHDRHRAEPEEVTCDDVSDLSPDDDRCAFVKAHCQSEALLNYPRLYYCHVQRHGPLLTGLMLVGAAT